MNGFNLIRYVLQSPLQDSVSIHVVLPGNNLQLSILLSWSDSGKPLFFVDTKLLREARSSFLLLSTGLLIVASFSGAFNSDALLHSLLLSRIESVVVPVEDLPSDELQISSCAPNGRIIILTYDIKLFYR